MATAFQLPPDVTLTPSYVTATPTTRKKKEPTFLVPAAPLSLQMRKKPLPKLIPLQEKGRLLSQSQASKSVGPTLGQFQLKREVK